MHGMVAWFTRNSVAANLLMLGIVLTGVWTLATGKLRTETFPEISLNTINVSVVYPGATPEDVETGICRRVEEAVDGLEGIKEIRSSANENAGTISIELTADADVADTLDKIKSRVDAITTFPQDAEEAVVAEVILYSRVLEVAVFADTDPASLKRVAEIVREELAGLEGISKVDVRAAKPWEISIEVSEATLREYNLTFDDVVNAVRTNSTDIPGGTIDTDGAEIRVRTKGQAYARAEFERIPVITRPDGTKLTIGDICTVHDGFADTDTGARFNGKPALMISVYTVGDQDALQAAATVKNWVNTEREQRRVTPAGVEFQIWQDISRLLNDRLSMLTRNGLQGFMLVLLVLALFLRLGLAFWVAIGIPICFLGAVLCLPFFDVTINLISLFAFILVLGIVVDDAIVTGESVYSEQQKGDKSGVEASIVGTNRVALPVIFAVLTTIVAFMPILYVPGVSGQIWRQIPIVVILTLLFSLVESKLILPSHLSHYKPRTKPPSPKNPLNWPGMAQRRIGSGLEWFIEHVYRKHLRFALNWRYLTVSIALAAVLLAGGLVGSGAVTFIFFPPVEADNVIANLTMPDGTPFERTEEALKRIETAAIELQTELRETYADQTAGPDGEPVDLIQNIMVSFGESQAAGGPGGRDTSSGANIGAVNLELAPAAVRNFAGGESVSAKDVSRMWRDKIGTIADAEELAFSDELAGVGEKINVQLTGRDLDQLRGAVDEVKAALAKYPGVIELADTYRGGKREVVLQDVTAEARTVGVTLADVGRQMRQAFYGDEAQRIQRGDDDVKVMVRYPESERRSLANVEDMHIRVRNARGEIAEVPFATAAIMTMDRAPSTITRIDGNRAINVTGDVDEDSGANTNKILADFTANDLPGILAQYPGVSYSLEGEQAEQRETMTALGIGFALALFGIFALLAIPLKSYTAPLVIMAAIPFGIIGAILGHFIVGISLSILSVVGIVALAGVVVNDSLVLVDRVRQNERGGMAIARAVEEGGVARFRAILLTSLTTFAGLTPIMLETSLQAQFLIPMAVSLAFGVLFSTSITLMLIPALYLISSDASRVIRWLTGRMKDQEFGAWIRSAEAYRGIPAGLPFARGRDGEPPRFGPEEKSTTARTVPLPRRPTPALEVPAPSTSSGRTEAVSAGDGAPAYPSEPEAAAVAPKPITLPVLPGTGPVAVEPPAPGPHAAGPSATDAAADVPVSPPTPEPEPTGGEGMLGITDGDSDIVRELRSLISTDHADTGNGGRADAEARRARRDKVTARLQERREGRGDGLTSALDVLDGAESAPPPGAAPRPAGSPGSGTPAPASESHRRRATRPTAPIPPRSADAAQPDDDDDGDGDADAGSYRI
jgi:multidrug efflux pump subunit AcrB